MPGRFHYGQLMHKALRGLMAEVLAEVAENGLPGEHHFFINFDTTHPGVDISARLKARYPEDMTIVIQHWFEDLSVLPDRFSITLNFSDTLEQLVIPFNAIQTFVDPSAEFGLRFDAQDGDEAEVTQTAPQDFTAEEPDDDPPDPGGGVVSLDKFRKG
ncbi:MAG: ClpXP protease specificity-enhancing factor SspB [Pseudomonadota bacterium]